MYDEGTTNPQEGLGMIKIWQDDLEVVYKEQKILKKDSA